MESDYIKESLCIKGFLDNLLAHKESGEVEFKSARGGFPGSFWETYSSFANTGGGVVIFGVREKHGIFSVDPLSEDTITEGCSCLQDSAEALLIGLIEAMLQTPMLQVPMLQAPMLQVPMLQVPMLQVQKGQTVI